MSVSRKIRKFKEFQVLNIYQNESFFQSLMPFFFVSTGIVFANSVFGAIRLQTKLDGLAYGMFPASVALSIFFNVILFQYASKVHKRSSQLCDSLRHVRSRNKTLQRRIRSLRPFGIQLMPLKHAKLFYMLQFQRASLDYTIAFLELYN